MKKILSFVLAFGMMLSLIGSIPAQAAIIEDYPYIYEDFETDQGTATGSVAAWVGNGAGVGGTNGALYFNQTRDAQDMQFKLPDPSIMLAEKVKMSAWIKLDTTKSKLKNTSFGFIFWGAAELNGTVTPDRWMTSWTVNNEAFNSGEWVYVEKILENWNGVMNSSYVFLPEYPGVNVRFAPRLGSPGSGKLSEALAEDSPTQELSWYLDDFIIEPVAETADDGGEEEPVDPKVLFDIDFSEPPSAYSEDLSLSANCTITDGALVYTKTDPSGYNDISIKVQPIKYNKIYKLSFRAKANDAATTGGLLKMIAIRGSSSDKSKMDANDPFYYYQFVHAMDAETGEQGKLTTEWRNYELYMTRQVKAALHTPLTFLFRCFSGSGADRAAVSYSIDDMKLVELDTVANGDFEWLKGDLPTTMEDSNMNNNDSKLYGTFYGWRDVDATVEAAAGYTGARSAKITVNADGGHVEQGIYIANNSQNVITFWAKGEGDSVGKSIQVKLDRDVATKGPKDVYDVETEILGENLVLTDDWQAYTIRYDLNAETPAGADANAEPRSPFMSFVVDGGAADLTYYIDDVAVAPYVAPEPPNVAPYVTDMAVTGTPLVGETVNFTYLYNSDVEMYEGYSMVRVIKELDDGKKITLAQMTSDKPETEGNFVPKYSYDYVVTEAAVGGKIKFEIMPFTLPDADGIVHYGTVYTSEATEKVKAPEVITPALGAFDAQSGSITGSLAVENNKTDGESLNLFLAIVLYDAEGGIIRYDSKPISVAASSTDSISLSVTTADDPDLAPIAYAKAFTWGGSGIFDTDLISYAKTITVTK